MAIISVQNVSKYFGERLLFGGVSFELFPGDRAGLVGVNGCGKSTLLRMIQGTESCDEGQIARARGSTVGFMEQLTLKNDDTLLDSTLSEFSGLMRMEEELSRIADDIDHLPAERDRLIRRQDELTHEYQRLGGLTYRSRARSALMGLGFTDAELTRQVATMSGGERNKAQLARLLLREPDLLLLDEPTNYLDITALNYLEGFLSSYSGCYIVVSHDRYFLDKVTNRTLELTHCALRQDKGNYSRYLELKSTEQELLLRRYQRTTREIRRIEGIVEQQRRWGQEHNFVTAASKLKQIEKLRTTLVAPDRAEKGIGFSFHVNPMIGEEVLKTDKLKKSFNGRTLFSDVDIDIRRGERVFLMGANGCGKTTLLKLLSKREAADSGSFYLGAGVLPAYYDQTMTGLDGEETVLEHVRNVYPRMTDTELRTALGAFLFTGDAVFTRMCDASGGERARVQLMKLMMSGANFLMLDEPTNHLDIASREALENALAEHEGTLLVVTHDRYLVNKLADRVLFMDGGVISEYYGGYDEVAAELEKKSLAVKNEKPASDNSYKARRELRSAINQAQGRVKRLEESIEREEATLSALTREMATPEIATDYIKAAEYAERETEQRALIDGLYADWEKETAALAELTGQAEE